MLKANEEQKEIAMRVDEVVELVDKFVQLSTKCSNGKAPAKPTESRGRGRGRGGGGRIQGGWSGNTRGRGRAASVPGKGVGGRGGGWSQMSKESIEDSA